MTVFSNSTIPGGGGGGNMSSPDVNNLFPAIAQSFVIILIGYLFGRFNIIPSSEARSIGVLVGKLALPALLFQNLAILDLTAISWPFMGGILIAKFAVFTIVAVITVIVTRPVSLGKGGIFGIFATQSNDFALGLPIVQALYGSSVSSLGNFNYVSYIYLLAPISLGVINPIGFVMMEYHKQSSKKKITWRHVPSILLRTLQGVLINPIIFMTFLGIVVNVIVYFGVNKQGKPASENLPDWLMGFLNILGGAYAACALFQIGLFMVGKLQKLTGMVIVIASLLITAKAVLLPILADLLVYHLLPNTSYNVNSSRTDIATFGFLYGTFPTAPTVFVFASQYNLAMEVVAASLVLCTFMSAPIMYISARMVLIPYTSEDQYSQIINDTRRDVTIITLICVVWVSFLFLLARRYRSYIHVFVMHLMVAQLIEVVAAELLEVEQNWNQVYWEYFWFSIFFIGVIASRMWLAWIGIGLILLIYKGPRVAERAWLPLMFSAWGVPFIITVVLVAASASREEFVDVSFLFGTPQYISTLVVLMFAFLTGMVCVITIVVSTRRRPATSSGQQGRNYKSVRYRREMKASPSSHSRNDPFTDAIKPFSVGVGGNIQSPTSQDDESLESRLPPQTSSVTTHLERDGIFLTDSQGSSESSSQGVILEPNVKTPLLQNEHRSSSSPEPVGFGTLPSAGVWIRDTSGTQLNRFVVLLIFLLFSCLMGILIVIWKLTSKEINGIFIAVNVLDTVTNFGQGFFVFAAFGLEKHWFWVAIYNRVRRLLFRIETVVLPPHDDLSVAVLNLCNTFKAQYLQACKQDIVSDKRYYLRLYESVFSGSDLVDWLLDRRLAETREDAVQYGQSLMLGRVIAHVVDEHYFHDEPYFYKFLV